MKKTPEHNFKVGDEICFARKSGAVHLTGNPVWIARIERALKTKLECTGIIGCRGTMSVDLRQYLRNIRIATDEDRQFLDNKAIQRQVDLEATKNHELLLDNLCSLFGELKPSVTSGNARDTFDVEFRGLTADQVRDLAGLINR